MRGHDQFPMLALEASKIFKVFFLQLFYLLQDDMFLGVTRPQTTTMNHSPASQGLQRESQA